MHTGAHIYNFEALIASWENTDPLARQLNGYRDIGNISTRLNPIREIGLVRKFSSIVFFAFSFFIYLFPKFLVQKLTLRQRKLDLSVDKQNAYNGTF